MKTGSYVLQKPYINTQPGKQRLLIKLNGSGSRFNSRKQNSCIFSTSFANMEHLSSAKVPAFPPLSSIQSSNLQLATFKFDFSLEYSSNRTRSQLTDAVS